MNNEINFYKVGWCAVIPLLFLLLAGIGLNFFGDAIWRWNGLTDQVIIFPALFSSLLVMSAYALRAWLSYLDHLRQMETDRMNHLKEMEQQKEDALQARKKEETALKKAVEEAVKEQLKILAEKDLNQAKTEALLSLADKLKTRTSEYYDTALKKKEVKIESVPEDVRQAILAAHPAFKEITDSTADNPEQPPHAESQQV